MTKFTPFNVRWQFSNSEAKLSNEIIPCRHGWCLHSWNTYPEKSLERFTDSWLHLGTLVLWIGGSAFSLHFKRYNQLDLIGIAGPYSLYPQYHMQWQFGIWLYLLYVFFHEHIYQSVAIIFDDIYYEYMNIPIDPYQWLISKKNWNQLRWRTY